MPRRRAEQTWWAGIGVREHISGKTRQWAGSMKSIICYHTNADARVFWTHNPGERAREFEASAGRCELGRSRTAGRYKCFLPRIWRTGLRDSKGPVSQAASNGTTSGSSPIRRPY